MDNRENNILQIANLFYSHPDNTTIKLIGGDGNITNFDGVILKEQVTKYNYLAAYSISRQTKQIILIAPFSTATRQAYNVNINDFENSYVYVVCPHNNIFKIKNAVLFHKNNTTLIHYIEKSTNRRLQCTLDNAYRILTQYDDNQKVKPDCEIIK